MALTKKYVDWKKLNECLSPTAQQIQKGLSRQGILSKSFRDSVHAQSKNDRRCMFTALKHLGICLNDDKNNSLSPMPVYCGGIDTATRASTITNNFFAVVLTSRFPGVICVPLEKIQDHLFQLREHHPELTLEYCRISETADSIAISDFSRMYPVTKLHLPPHPWNQRKKHPIATGNHPL